jgi:hypothetical protein
VDRRGDEVTGGWRKLHEELHNLYCSPSVIRIIKSRRMRWTGHVARKREKDAYRILAGKSEGKVSLLGRRRRRWEDNIKMDPGEMGWGSMDWSRVA